MGMVIYLNAAIRSSELEKKFHSSDETNQINDLTLLGGDSFNSLTEVAHSRYEQTDLTLMHVTCYWYELTEFTRMIFNKFSNNNIPEQIIKCINDFCTDFSNVNENKRQSWYNILSVVPGMQYYDYDQREHIIVYLAENTGDGNQNYNGFMISFNYCNPYGVEVKFITTT